MQPLAVWTVGHSNHPLETFAQLLLLHQVQLIADVRSHPYSKFAPHYGCEELPNTLSNLGVQYVFMGVALGGRPTNVEHYDEEGHALYEPMSKEPEFCEAIEEVCNRASQQHLALLCSEADPGVLPPASARRQGPRRAGGAAASHHGGRLRGH